MTAILAGSGAQRFKLIHLEEGEEYVSDFACTLHLEGPGLARTEIQGRMRICSKSLIFDGPELLKIFYKKIEILELIGTREISGAASSVSAVPLSLTGGKWRAVAGHTVRPGTWKFQVSPTYAAAARAAPRVFALWQAHRSLSRHEAQDVIKSILLEIEAEDPPRFDYASLANHRETPLLPDPLGAVRVSKLTETRGLVQVTLEYFYFQPSPNFSRKPHKRVALANIAGVFKRFYRLEPIGLEIVTHSGKGFFILLKSEQQRDRLLSVLPAQRAPPPPPVTVVTGLWQSGQISNFHYLEFLNFSAGRSYNDISQYPVFPWTLKEFSASGIDFANSSVFRDFTKPAGAQDPVKLEKLRKSRGEDAAFLFGTHYSTPAYAIYFLLRKFPECALRLHGGHFDLRARLFTSAAGAWAAVADGGATVELIPEFYSQPGKAAEWLGNALGVEGLSSVALPPWAHGDAKFFVASMRCALESPAVSDKLHAWIDLIFGAKSRGEAARAADNLFHPASYLQALNPGDPDAELKQQQVQEFGRVPDQLFTDLHPQRTVIPGLKLPSYFLDERNEITWRQAIDAALTRVNSPTPSPAVIGKRVAPREKVTIQRVSREPLTAIACEKSGKFAAAGTDGVLRFGDKKSFRVSHFPLAAVASLSNGNFAAAGIDRSITVASADHGTRARACTHADAVTCLAGGARLLSGSRDQTVRLWDFAKTGNLTEISILDGHEDSVTAVTFLPDGLLLSGDSAGCVILWDPRMQNPLAAEFLFASGVGVVGLSESVVGYSDGTALFLDARGGLGERARFTVDGLSAVAVAGDSAMIGSVSGEISRFDMTTRTVSRLTLPPVSSRISGVARAGVDSAVACTAAGEILQILLI